MFSQRAVERPGSENCSALSGVGLPLSAQAVASRVSIIIMKALTNQIPGITRVMSNPLKTIERRTTLFFVDSSLGVNRAHFLFFVGHTRDIGNSQHGIPKEKIRRILCLCNQR